MVSPPLSSAPAASATGRSVPNLPGALIRRLSGLLGVSPTIAIRVAVLYGDLEWQAAGRLELPYSASDYARRMGLHRNTVHADLRRLESLGAVALSSDRANSTTVALLGLPQELPAAATPAAATPAAATPVAATTPAHASSKPCPPDQPAPCPSLQQGPAHGSSNPLLKRPATLEKGSKTQEKRSQKAAAATAAEFGEQAALEAISSQASSEALLPEQAQSEARQPAACSLIEQLLQTFRRHAPPEWGRPERLTLSSSRQQRLRRALAHAGGAEQLQQRLQAALAHVPGWYRSTYPLRPDGSRRPGYQFFDLLFRAAACERDCGVEAWFLFAWSEAASSSAGSGSRAVAPEASAEAELLRAQLLFLWDPSLRLWRCQGIEALRLPLVERRRLTGLLERHGHGVSGTGAHQFADICGDGCAAVSGEAR